MKVDAYQCDRCNRLFVGDIATDKIWHIKAVKKNPKFDDVRSGVYCISCLKGRTLKILRDEDFAIKIDNTNS